MNTPKRLWLLLGLLALTLGGCVVPSGNTTTDNKSPEVLGIDPARYVILEFERTGGFAGFDDHAQLFMDGHVALVQRNAAPVMFQLSQAEMSQVQAALDGADFYRQAAQPQPTPAPAIPDAFHYRIYRRGLMLQGEVAVQDGSIPEWVAPLLPLLTQLLLQPDPTRLTTATPAAFGAPIAPTAIETAEAPALVLLEYVRSRPGSELRVLVNLDRSYSMARDGQVSEGMLTREEMAALLQLLEAADLKTHAGRYMADLPCSDCITYQITYRNLLGQSKVSGQSDALPEWLAILTATLDAGFEMPDAIAVATPAAAATASPIAAAATSATPAAETSTPQELAYGVQDLLADLAEEGATISGPTERVTKPYLAVDGVAMQVQGQPLLVFRYANAEALATDVAGLAADASSINGKALSWAAAPHFWQRGDMLVLLASDDRVLVEMVRGVLGEPFAAR